MLPTFIQHVLQILHRSYHFESDRMLNSHDFLAELAPDLRISSQLEEVIAQTNRSGVIAGQEDVEKLVPKVEPAFS